MAAFTAWISVSGIACATRFLVALTHSRSDKLSARNTIKFHTKNSVCYNGNRFIHPRPPANYIVNRSKLVQIITVYEGGHYFRSQNVQAQYNSLCLLLQCLTVVLVPFSAVLMPLLFIIPYDLITSVIPLRPNLNI